MGAARAGCFVGTEVEFGPSIIATLSEPLLTLQNLSAHCVCNISSSSSPHTPILCCAIKPKQQRANAKQENTGETATFPICININFAGHVCFFCVYSLTIMIFDTQPFGRKNYYITTGKQSQGKRTPDGNKSTHLENTCNMYSERL